MDRLSPERWKQIDELFAAALELEPSERDAFVRLACEGDEELYREVIALLESEAEAEAAIGDSVDTFAAPLLAELDADAFDGDATLAPGVRVGPYRIVHEIGRGGMGVVYLAERADEQFEKRVALKVVKRGMDTDEVLRRFRHERQILASLDHPNIARLLDGGATADGRPYLVMEYIEGEPIDAYCDRRGLGIRERLDLFRAVCNAVQHAYQRLVVHRDIKPSNILVTDAGEPKLLDFGIAKLLDDSATDATPRTRTGVRMLTPEYASPEQVRGAPVTTASDVYALGVVLYRLLSGRPPYEVRGLSVAEAERAVEQEPPPPSVAAVRKAEASAAEADAHTVASPADVARSRNTTPDALRRALRGDLDAIALKALAKDPQRRYGSPALLADDIGRYLAGLPVTARAPRTAYVVSRFIRRHRVGVAAAAAFVLLLAGSAAALGVAQARTARALAQAEQERATAEEVASFLESMFSAANPLAVSRERLDTLRVRALLDRGAERIREELVDRPIVHARMLRVIGRTYREMGDYAAAEPLLAEALDRARATGQPRDIAEALTDLGQVYLARGRPGDAEPLLREALALRQEAATAATPREVAVAFANLAASLQDQSRLDEAAPLYDSAIALVRTASTIDSATLADVLGGRMVLAYRTGDLETAAGLGREVLDINRALLGPDHPRVARETNNLAQVLQRMGRHAEAEPLYREALRILKATVGPEHPYTALGMSNLAAVLDQLDRDDEADSLFRATIALQRRILPPGAPTIAPSLANYADLLQSRNAYREAELLYREAIELQRAALGEDHPDIGILTGKLGGALCAAGRVWEGVPLLERAASVLDRALPAGHARTLEVRLQLGRCLARRGSYTEAEGILLATLEAIDAGGTATAVLRGGALRVLEELYTAWGKPERAAEYAARLRELE